MNPALRFAIAGVAFWSCVFYLGWRFVRAMERRDGSRSELEELRARVERLEQELVSTTTELERLSAGHEFTTNLLAARAGIVPPPNDRRGRPAVYETSAARAS